MGRSSRCVGMSLYNHLKQLNIQCDIEYEFDKVALVWSGVMSVFGTTYKVTGKQSKREVVNTLMANSNSFIQSNLSAKKISS